MMEFDEEPRELERRSQPRSLADQYASVEFSVSNLGPVYLFKIWDFSSSGVGILVKEDSDVLKHLKVGDVRTMRYYTSKSSDNPNDLKTQIRHITKDD